MARGPTAKRYARAAFDIARESGNIEGWSDALQRATEALQDEGLLATLEYPKLTAARKVEIISGAFSGFEPLVVNLLGLLATRNRIGLLPRITEEYQQLVDAHYGRVRARVITAVPMEPEQSGRIKRQLEQMIGQEVVVTSEIDPDVLGGVIARVGDRIIDGSLRGKLLALRNRLAEMPR